MDNKQEAIKIITQELCNYKHPGLSPPCNDCMNAATFLYDRIAPLIAREFAEEEIRALVKTHLHVVNFAHPGPQIIGIDDFLKGLKQLLEGQSAGQEQPRGFYPTCGVSGKDILEKRPTCRDTGEGTCPKCGGSKKVPSAIVETWDEEGHPARYKMIDCPICDGSGECQHKELEIATLITHSMPRCAECRLEVEQRSGTERRGIPNGRRILPERRKAG